MRKLIILCTWWFIANVDQDHTVVIGPFPNEQTCQNTRSWILKNNTKLTASPCWGGVEIQAERGMK